MQKNLKKRSFQYTKISILLMLASYPLHINASNDITKTDSKANNITTAISKSEKKTNSLLNNKSKQTIDNNIKTIDEIKPNETYNQFNVEYIYTNDANKNIGARFLHKPTGFILDYLQIESVPQGFIWVNSFPSSDKGEPHTQEHLLLGKGNKGRWASSFEPILLSDSSAYTMQWKTCYHFNTLLDKDGFFKSFDIRLDALFNPDYTDEEIRREVRNFGVVEDEKSNLRLEEKGTVYNEMVSAYERPWSRLFREVNTLTYGKKHPLTMESGGEPSAIRQMTPEDIRFFHKSHYYPGNMGMIVSFPKNVAIMDILKDSDKVLNKYSHKKYLGEKIVTEKTLPKPEMSPIGSVSIVSYPHQEGKQAGTFVYQWPATKNLSLEERLYLEMFISSIAGDSTTNLYNRFMDAKTRDLDIGVSDISMFVSGDMGNPVAIFLDGVRDEFINETYLIKSRDIIINELKKISEYKDDSDELKSFQLRIQSRLKEYRRKIQKWVGAPPGFGTRQVPTTWIDHMVSLEKYDQGYRSLTLKKEIDSLFELTNSSKNVWRDYISKWNLLSELPFSVATKSDSALFEKEKKEREGRISEEISRLKKQYSTEDTQIALKKYSEDYEKNTKILKAESAKSESSIGDIESPPLTFDDGIKYEITKSANDVPIVVSTFDSMINGSVGVAIRLDGSKMEDFPYISVLPALIGSVGLYSPDNTVSYNVMKEQIRNEILELKSYFKANYSNGRMEWVIKAGGNTPEETKKAVSWIDKQLFSMDLRPENRSRILDIVNQEIGMLKATTQMSEEMWVETPSSVYWRQDNPNILAFQSFFTRAHLLQRLRWQLMPIESELDRLSIDSFLKEFSLAGKELSKENLNLLLSVITSGLNSDLYKNNLKNKQLIKYLNNYSKLTKPALLVAIEAARDLSYNLTEMPESSIPKDFSYICEEMRRDLKVGYKLALNRIQNAIDSLRVTGRTRTFFVGSTENQKEVFPMLNSLLAKFKSKNMELEKYPTEKYVDKRLKDRIPSADPKFVGLLFAGSSSGVVINSSDMPTIHDLDRESMIRYLSSMIFTGHGSHSMFMKTWEAGLAYSNGIRASAVNGRLTYYAERCPELPQTIQFVVNQLKGSEKKPELITYAFNQTFLTSRAYAPYELRAEQLASDIADGITPDAVKKFRQKILEIRKEKNVGDLMWNNVFKEYAKILPGFSKTPDQNANYFIVGSEKQFSIYENYLKNNISQDITLYALYPRDFWLEI